MSRGDSDVVEELPQLRVSVGPRAERGQVRQSRHSTGVEFGLERFRNPGMRQGRDEPEGRRGSVVRNGRCVGRAGQSVCWESDDPRACRHVRRRWLLLVRWRWLLAAWRWLCRCRGRTASGRGPEFREATAGLGQLALEIGGLELGAVLGRLGCVHRLLSLRS